MTLNVVTWSPQQERSGRLTGALAQAGYRLVGQAASLSEVRQALMMARAEVLVFDADRVESSQVEELGQLYRERSLPIVVFVDHSETTMTHAAIRAGVSAYVVDGFAAQRIKPVIEEAVARFLVWQCLVHEREAAAAQLDENKTIERAKGILMRRRNVPETTAYKALQQMAADCGKRMVQVAQKIIDVEAALAGG